MTASSGKLAVSSDSSSHDAPTDALVTAMSAMLDACSPASLADASKLLARVVLVLGVPALRDGVTGALRSIGAAGTRVGSATVAWLARVCGWIAAVLRARRMRATRGKGEPRNHAPCLDVTLHAGLPFWRAACGLRDGSIHVDGYAVNAAVPGGAEVFNGACTRVVEVWHSVTLTTRDLIVATLDPVVLTFDETSGAADGRRSLVDARVGDRPSGAMSRAAEVEKTAAVKHIADLIPFEAFAAAFRAHVASHVPSSVTSDNRYIYNNKRFVCIHDDDAYTLVGTLCRAIKKKYPNMIDPVNQVAYLMSSVPLVRHADGTCQHLLHAIKESGEEGEVLEFEFLGARSAFATPPPSLGVPALDPVPEDTPQLDEVRAWIAAQLLPGTCATAAEPSEPGGMRVRLWPVGGAPVSREAMLRSLGEVLSTAGRAAVGVGGRVAPPSMFTLDIRRPDARQGEGAADTPHAAPGEGDAKRKADAATNRRDAVVAGERATEQEPTVRTLGASRKVARTLESVHLKTRDARELQSALWLFENRDAHRHLGVANKLCIMLHGPPGTGKSVTLEAIASSLGRDVYSVSLADVRSNSELRMVFEHAFAQRNGILALEDMDTAPGVRKRVYSRAGGDAAAEGGEGTRTGFTLDCLLNLLQGPSTPEGAVVVATTNHLEALDGALTRDMRFDCKLNLTPCDAEQLGAIYRAYMRRDLPRDISRRIEERLARGEPVTPATATMRLRGFALALETGHREVADDEALGWLFAE